MGAWGHGPFDSDAALDYLGRIADTHASVDDDYDIVAGSVDHPAVTRMLRAVMASTDLLDAAEMYAAAGLVAAALDPALTPASSGTRLGAALDAAATGQQLTPLGLDAHCGHLTLLRPEDAAQLVPAARAAVSRLRQMDAWTRTWRDDITPTLDALDAALAAHTPA